MRYCIFGFILALLHGCKSGSTAVEDSTTQANRAGVKDVSFVQCLHPRGYIQFYKAYGEVHYVTKSGKEFQSHDDGLNFAPKILEVFPPIYAVYITDEEGESIGNWQAKKMDKPTEVEYKNKKYTNCELISGKDSGENEEDPNRILPPGEKPTGSYAECPVGGDRTIRFYTKIGKIYYTRKQSLTELYQENVEFVTTPSPLEIFPPFYNTSIKQDGKLVGNWARQLNDSKFEISYLVRNPYRNCTWHDKDFE